jgi:predicted GNAT family N-acyltransferase
MAEPPHFHIVDADYARDYPLLRAVREPVFVIEQKVPLAMEWDALDPNCHHVLALDQQNNPIGTGRLTPEHTIGRMAVLSNWRGRGVGDALLTRLINKARQLGWPSISLHAQHKAVGFYQKHGFGAHGELYEEAGIWHQSMTLSLINTDE